MRAGDFVHVVFQRGDYVDRFVVSSPIHCHTVVVVLVSKDALDRACLKTLPVLMSLVPVKAV
jgi:hypothetical protein